MKLTPDQLAQFDRDGYLFFPKQFSTEEMRVLTDAVPELYARREVYNVREKGSDSVRTNFAAHMYSEPFARLARHPRMVEPVQDLLGEALWDEHAAIADAIAGGDGERAAALIDQHARRASDNLRTRLADVLATSVKGQP